MEQEEKYERGITACEKKQGGTKHNKDKEEIQISQNV
jgi:hypothetical protein